MSPRRLRHEISSLLSDKQGSHLVFVALLLPGIMGFAAMSIDVAMWYQEKQNTQNIADFSAVAATHVNLRGGDLTEMATAALADAVRNGYVAGPNNHVIVTASRGGPMGNVTPIVDVVVRRAVPLFVMTAFKNEQQVITATATGGTRVLKNPCVIGLGDRDPGKATSRNGTLISNTYIKKTLSECDSFGLDLEQLTAQTKVVLVR